MDGLDDGWSEVGPIDGKVDGDVEGKAYQISYDVHVDISKKNLRRICGTGNIIQING